MRCWSALARNEVSGKTNVLRTIKRRFAECVGHILPTDCRLKHLVEGKIEGKAEGMDRRGRKPLLDLKEKGKCGNSKEKELDSNHRWTHYGTDYVMTGNARVFIGKLVVPPLWLL
jgi:hypothetical protein